MSTAIDDKSMQLPVYIKEAVCDAKTDMLEMKRRRLEFGVDSYRTALENRLRDRLALAIETFMEAVEPKSDP